MLLAHNQQTLEELESYIDNYQNCCVVNPCGSGKTSIMSEFIKRHLDKDIIVFTKQQNAANYYRERDDVFNYVNIVTYSKMLIDYNNSNIDKYQADIYILDEAHYIGASKWNVAFDFIKSRFNPLLVGVTATPQRYKQQGTDATIVTELFDGNSAGNYTTKELQDAGVFIEPEYVLSLLNFECDVNEKLEQIEEYDGDDNIKDKWRLSLENALEDWRLHASPRVILRKKLPLYMYKEHCNRIIVYSPSIQDMRKHKDRIDSIIKTIFKEKEVVSYCYSTNDPSENLKKFLEEDSAYVKILYSVDKIMETVHIDDLCISIMLRPSASNRIITQQFGRINSIGNKNKALIIDMVGNLARLNSTNFLGGIAPSRKNDEDRKVKLNLKYFSKYGNLFDEIDRVFSRSVYYKCHNFYGTLYQISKNYKVIYGDLKKLVIEDGIDVNDAIDILYKNKRFNMKQNVFDGYEEYKPFTLSDQQREIATECIPLVDEFAKSRGITDEDTIQDLYIAMMEHVSTGISKQHLNYSIHTKLNKEYGIYCAHRYMRDLMWADESFDIMIDDITYSSVVELRMKDYIIEVFDKLTDREKKVLKLRFGIEDGQYRTLEEVGYIFNVHRERIRQIEAKAFRKLRCHGLSKRFKGWYDSDY